jgi:hypothetical protein
VSTRYPSETSAACLHLRGGRQDQKKGTVWLGFTRLISIRAVTKDPLATLGAYEVAQARHQRREEQDNKLPVPGCCARGVYRQRISATKTRSRGLSRHFLDEQQINQPRAATVAIAQELSSRCNGSQPKSGQSRPKLAGGYTAVFNSLYTGLPENQRCTSSWRKNKSTAPTGEEGQIGSDQISRQTDIPSKPAPQRP